MLTRSPRSALEPIDRDPLATENNIAAQVHIIPKRELAVHQNPRAWLDDATLADSEHAAAEDVKSLRTSQNALRAKNELALDDVNSALFNTRAVTYLYVPGSPYARAQIERHRHAAELVDTSPGKQAA